MDVGRVGKAWLRGLKGPSPHQTHSVSGRAVSKVAKHDPDPQASGLVWSGRVPKPNLLNAACSVVLSPKKWGHGSVLVVGCAFIVLV